MRVDVGPMPSGERATTTRYEAPAIELALPAKPRDYYRHGWQSWSLACWHPVDALIPVQKPTILHPMQCDPRYATMREPNGSSVGAVRFEDGTVLLLGALGLDAHVALVDGELRGWYDGETTTIAGTIDAAADATRSGADWLVATGPEAECFSAYAEALADGDRHARGRAPRVWCSWYSLYTGISETVLHAVLDDLGDLPFDVIQVDDGWQRDIGDWEANAKFPSGMRDLTDRIRATGRRAGLWLAPLIVSASSHLAREHGDWLLRETGGRPVSAGFNWGRPLYALDTSNRDVLDWLAALMRTVRSWGYDYVKLDFLYGGALSRSAAPHGNPGVRDHDGPGSDFWNRADGREAAYRRALAVIREALEDAWFVACGAPVIPSLGLCDALRIGPDVAGFWASDRDDLLANPTTPGTRNAIRTSAHRLWLRRLVALDPDVVYVSERGNTLSPSDRAALQGLAKICGYVATSDLPHWFAGAPGDDARLRGLFADAGQETVDQVLSAPRAMETPAAARGYRALIAGLLAWAGNRRFVLRLVAALDRASARRRARAVITRS